MTLAELYAAIEEVNESKITSSEFIERTYGYIKDVVDNSQAPDKEEMFQDIVVCLMEKINRGVKFNRTFFKWQLQTEIDRRIVDDTKEILDNLSYTMDTDMIAMRITISNMRTALTDRENRIIRDRFYNDMTLQEVGKELGVSGDRIRQIECKALRKMRRHSYSLKDFI